MAGPVVEIAHLAFRAGRPVAALLAALLPEATTALAAGAVAWGLLPIAV